MAYAADTYEYDYETDLDYRDEFTSGESYFGSESYESGESSTKVHFPMIIFMIALAKDMLDIVTAGTLSFIVTPIVGLVLYFWAKDKSVFVKDSPIRKKLVRSALVRAGVELVPLVDIYPSTTGFVLKVHKEEKKMKQRTTQPNNEIAYAV